MGHADDPTTLDRLVRTHLAAALRLAVRLSGDADAAEEIVQDALLRVARSWATFRHEAQFRTWLFRIVINVFRDRAAGRPPPGPLPADAADPRSDNPAAAAEADELNRRVAACVSALPQRQREVMVLLTYEGMSPSEVAQLLGISEANVYVTRHLARQRLRDALAPWLVEK